MKAGTAGTEIDLGAMHPVGGGLGVRGGYAVFLPDEGRYGPGAAPIQFREIELLFQR